MDTLSAITRGGVEQAIAEWDEIGREAFLEKYGFSPPTGYVMVVDEKTYAPKAILGAAYGYSVGNPGGLPPSAFSGGEQGANRRLRDLGFEVKALAGSVPTSVPSLEVVDAERARRLAAWNDLAVRGGPRAVSPALVRELGLYGGQQGIWVDSVRTGQVASPGVTVSVLHRGTRYADDLWDDGLLYHYPETKRGSRDQAEIEATKWAKRLQLPIFVITNAEDSTDARDVRMAWVEEWDDSDKVFLIDFGPTPQVPQPIPEPEAPFALEAEGKTGTAQIETRLGQQRFKIECIAYYGASCAVCGLSIRQLLDGAHIRPKKEKGSDDPRNGLILCAIHHRAYDAGFFSVEPDSFQIRTLEGGPTLEELRVRHGSVTHLTRKPHPDALRWAWERWKKRSS
ncbi:MAG: HNH endonuclease [Anaeromyxobacteraceae bacterium]